VEPPNSFLKGADFARQSREIISLLPLKPYSENFVLEAILMSFETCITVSRPTMCVWLCNNTILGMKFYESNSSLLLPFPSFLPAPSCMPVLIILGWL